MRQNRILVLALVIFILVWIVNYLIAIQCPNCLKEEELSKQMNKLDDAVESLIKQKIIVNHDVKAHLKQIRSQTLVNKLRLLSDFDVKETREISEMNAKKSLKGSVLRLHSIPKTFLDNGRPVIAVLVLSCNRVSVKRSLDRLLRYRPSKEQFPIIVSQDCSHKPTSEIIRSYGDQLHWIKQPDQSDIYVPPKERKFKGYFKIARHYGWALNYTFFHIGFSTVIIVEDDLDVSNDFFEYFSGTYHLLKDDPTLWCVSAWNDNGIESLIDSSQSQLLYRTDLFPGLGWMLNRTIWTELASKWPRSYWDDWIREPEQRKGRSCIRPEVSRTKTFGKIGVSNGLFYEKHLKYIKLNEHFVNFTQLNLSYLLKHNYDSMYMKQVYDSRTIAFEEIKSPYSKNRSPVKIIYSTRNEYKKYCKQLGLMDDLKSGVGRTAYKGVVSFYKNSIRSYIAPKLPWSGYNKTWS